MSFGFEVKNFQLLTQRNQFGAGFCDPRDILTTIDDRMMATMMRTILKQ